MLDYISFRALKDFEALQVQLNLFQQSLLEVKQTDLVPCLIGEFSFVTKVIN